MSAKIFATYHGAIFVIFCILYAALGPTHFKYDNSFQPLYFAAVTHATVGYGDIAPATNIARAIAGTHAMLSMLSPVLYMAWS